MSASYPTSTKTWTPVVDDTDKVLAAHINELYEEVIALETSVAGEVLNITSVGSLVNGATEKTTPIDADMVGLMDSEHTNVLYKLSWANIKATLKTYFDTLYNKVTVNNTLTSTSTTEALSAAQGKVLAEQISTMMIKFTNVTVLTTAFVSDTTYTEFPFKVDIACNGVTVDYIPEIYFDVADAIGGNYAPVALSGTNKVTIYAVEVPTANLTIPTIKCTKAVN